MKKGTYRMVGGPADGTDYTVENDGTHAVDVPVVGERGIETYRYTWAKNDRGADVLVCEGMYPIRKTVDDAL